ncbi:MAG: hypothetical protein WAM92_09995 [Mycobacterium sp.]
MTNRGWLIFCVGAVLLATGLLALNFPVFIDAWDQWGWQVKCGTGYNTDLAQAEIATQAGGRGNLVDACQSALAIRRAWTITVALAGWVLLSGLAIALWRHAAAHHHHEHQDTETVNA